MPQVESQTTKKILHLGHVSIIVQKIKAWAKATFALISHTHAMDDITDLSGAIGTIDERINNIEQSADEVLPFGGFVQVAQKDVKNATAAEGGAGFIAFNETTQRFVYALTAKPGAAGQPPTILTQPEYYGGFMGVGTYNDGGAEGYPFPDKLYLYQDRTYVFDKHSLVPTDNKPYVVEIEMDANIPDSLTLGTIDPGTNLQDVFNGTSGNLVYDTEYDAIYFVAGSTYYEEFPGKELVCQSWQIPRPRRDVIYKWVDELYFYSGGEMIKLASGNALEYVHETQLFYVTSDAGVAAKKTNFMIGKDGTMDRRKEFHVSTGYVANVVSDKTNTAKNPTLEIGDSGACPIYYAGAAITTSNLDKAGKKDYVQQYVFLNDKWYWVGWSQDTNTTYTAMTYNGTNGHLDAGTSTTGMVISPKTLKSFVEDKVNEKVSTLYRPMGSCSSSYLKNLPLTQKLGDGEWALPNGSVYNITDELTTDDNFVEGAGKTYPAGTNVVLVEPSAGVRKWDVLAGSVDLSGYVNKSEFLDELMGNVNSGKIVNDVYIEGNDVKVQLQTNTSVQYQPHTLFSFATDTEVGDAVQTELNKN